MIRIWISGIIAIMLTMPAWADESHSELETANMDAIGAMFAAFGAGDMDAMLAAMTEDITWEVNGSSADLPLHGTWQGHDGVLAWMEAFDSRIEVMDFAVDGMWADGDVVFVLVHNSGRVKSTGVVVEQQELMMFWLVEGKVSRMLDFDDSVQQYFAMQGADDGTEDRD
ncbi:nuclear transport factor 2 family protein [bacterium]|nr:nuclear transport factor 2 family protein [bacterium]